jgi:hypothetical protein
MALPLEKAAQVWVVEQGSYSDYRVVGVFTSEKNANKIADAINAGDKWENATVACWPLNPAVEELNAGMTQWVVWMLRNGDVERADQRDSVSSYDLAGECDLWKRPPHMNKPWCLNATVWATDKQHAIKIVNERRIAMLAANKWPEKEGRK